jgi:carbonyl reductase 1
MTTSRTAVVTGANQGLGLALVDGLARRLGPAGRVLLTGRDPGRVTAAAEALGAPTVEARVLDVTSTSAVDALAAELGGVDIVFANATAPMTPGVDPATEVDLLVETNNYGTDRILRAFGPLLRPGGRLLVVASSLGTLDHLDPPVRAMLAGARTLEDVEAVVDGWRRAVHDGTAESLGWPRWLNLPSKVAQVASVRAVAGSRPDALILAVCPGLIDTRASRPWFADMSTAQTPAQAAAALLDLALAPAIDPALRGELVQFGKVLPWDPNAETE